jgi:hypothetical protein
MNNTTKGVTQEYTGKGVPIEDVRSAMSEDDREVHYFPYLPDNHGGNSGYL